MSFRKINNWLHLWLGLISGSIVLIVCLTGYIWVFNEEINSILNPETNIEKQSKPIISPSRIKQIAAAEFPNMNLQYVIYQQGRTAEVYFNNKEGEHAKLNINPYSGDIISKTFDKDGSEDFFDFILRGHRFLWLPYEIGRPIVNYGTLVFVVLLITGLVWWYPKKWNKKTKEKSFSIKWNASFKRLNIDIHNVLGFYALLFLLAIALTGMVWGIQWYSEGLYWITSGGNELKEFTNYQSDTVYTKKLNQDKALDFAFLKTINKHPNAGGFYYSYPDSADKAATINIYIYPTKGQFYNSMSYHFDQYSLEELTGNHEVYDKPYNEGKFGTKLRRMNYDIHVGSILGFPGKLLAFLSSLIGASLPITGFLIWWGRKFGKSKLSKRSKNYSSEIIPSEQQKKLSLKSNIRLRQYPQKEN
jgi:uncharacterized iron-regulated membrane protein